MIHELYHAIISLLNITFGTDALWTVIPLLISTLLMVIYFGIYSKEKAGWNTHFSNSFVLIFVSIALLKFIYTFEDGGGYNFIDYFPKSLLIVALLSFGLILVRFNLGHVLPEKFSNYLSSSLTVNLMAYVIILLVYSEGELTWLLILAAIIIVLILMGLLVLIKIPMSKFSKYLKDQKRKDRLRNVREAGYQISELKRELKDRETELKKLELNEAEKEKKEAISIKKIIRKIR